LRKNAGYSKGEYQCIRRHKVVCFDKQLDNFYQ